MSQDLFGYSKEEKAIERLRMFCPPEGYYFANSYGKDSCVCRDLLIRSGVKYDSHHNLTTVDPPELVLFGRKHHPETIVHKPSKSMWKLIADEGIPPTRLMRYCCEYLKENVAGSVGRMVITGIRWEESAKRAKRKQFETCTRRKWQQKKYLHAIIDWTNDEIWSYLKARKIPYCKLYDEGFKRLGCIGCPMAGGAGQKREFLRYPKFKAAHIRAFDEMVKRRKADGRDTKWNSGEEVMAWWMSQSKGAKLDESCNPLFI